MEGKTPAHHDVIMAGIGGRGIMMIGLLLAQAALKSYNHASWLPTYAAAMRGGECECTVVISDEEMPCPIVPQAEVVIIMEASQLKLFEGRARPGGMIVLDSSVIQEKVTRDDVRALNVPATAIANAIGQIQAANMVLLGAYLEMTKVVSLEAIEDELDKRLAGREPLLEANKKALREGAKTVASGKV